jgi:single-strand DNA-binding protein
VVWFHHLKGAVIMLNRVQLIGHLGADPEIRYFPQGERYATFRLAATERWKDRQTGERKERTEWINVVVYRPALVPVIEQYLKTGSRVYVEGKLHTSTYQKDGADRYWTQVVLQTLQLLDRKPEDDSNVEAHSAADPAAGEMVPPEAEEMQAAA